MMVDDGCLYGYMAIWLYGYMVDSLQQLKGP